MSSFLKRLQSLAQEAGDKRVLHWMNEKGLEEASLSSHEIWVRSGAVADKIVKYVKPGERVMIVYPFGLEFLIGLIGCMRAGVIAVSVYPPNPANFKNDIPKFCKYFEDCGATRALTTGRYYMLAKAYGMTSLFGGASWPKGMEWLTTDFSCDQSYVRSVQEFEPSPQDIAFIQYTSGSTGDPKGVCISFRALDANLEGTIAVLGIEPGSTGVLWLPQYHDLGLVGGFLGTCFSGCTTYFISPLTFIQNPLLWADLIERHSGTHLAAPTFAYGLLAKRIRQAGRKYDLTSVVNAVISAEPIRAAVLKNMREIGIPNAAIDQAYGAAESVAFILSGGRGLDNGNPSCGVLSQSAKFGKRVLVVDEEVSEVLPEGAVGMVLITGPDLASGYWDKPELNSKVFNLTVPGVEGAWYKTGDLGYIKDDQLYLTGRRKDVIIIQGRNFYPQDLEWSAEEQCKGQLRPGCVAAGQLDDSSAFICGELNPSGKALSAEDAAALARAVYAETKVAVGRVVVLRKNSLPKTSSGKIRRAATRDAVLEGGFKAEEVLLEWTAPADGTQVTAEHDQPAVAIIGAGPAGMVAAHALAKRGYTRVVVMEREDKEGGRSVGYGGYDEIYIGGGEYRAIAALAAEYAVPFPLPMPSRLAIPPPVSMPEEAAAPSARSLQDTAVLELWAKAGYGVMDDRTPLHYVYGPFSEVCTARNYASGAPVPMDYFQFPPHFFADLWGAMRERLAANGVEFRFSKAVEQLGAHLVDGEFFDKIIVAVMPQDAWQLTREPLLERLRTNRYGMVVFAASGLAADEEYHFERPHSDAGLVGHPLQIYNKSGVWYALVYAQLAEASREEAEVSEATMVTTLRAEVERLGGEMTEVLAVKLWDFFPHVRDEDVRNGFYRGWEEEMQGAGGLYWTGAMLGFDLTEAVARHAEGVVARFFPSQITPEEADDLFAVEALEETDEWYRKIQEELYPLFPRGPTGLFPKYYQYTGRQGVYQSAQWMMDAVGEVTMEPDASIPEELRRGFLGRQQQLAARVRFIETEDKLEIVPFKHAPTMQIEVAGNCWNMTGGLRANIPGSAKCVYALTKGHMEGEDRSEEVIGPLLPLLEDEECVRRVLANVFGCSGYYGTGGGDVFRSEHFVACMFAIPRKRYAPPAPAGDFFADSLAVLDETEVQYDLMLQYGEWRGCGFFVDEDRFDPFACDAVGEWDPSVCPVRRLGSLRLPVQNVREVDHDATAPWSYRVGIQSDDWPLRNAFWSPTGIRLFYSYFKNLSTAEFGALSDGRIDVKNTLLTKVAQIVDQHPDDIDLSVSPLQLGLNSFHLVQLAQFVQVTYKAEFPVTLFFDLPTLNDVVEYIRAQGSGGSFVPEQRVKHTSLVQGQVVALKHPSLWCFPPIIGSGVYRVLSKRLPADFELCELTDLSFYCGALEEETIHSLAERYAAAIRSLQAQGPYALCGFSFGSILAHAVSHLLGSDCSAVIMLDGIAPTARSTSIKHFTDSEKVNSFIFRQLKAGASYKAQRSPASKVVLVVAEDQSFYDGTDVDNKETLGWLPIEPDIIPVFVEGSHLSIMREPQVQTIAQIVLIHCAEVPETPRRPTLLTSPNNVFAAHLDRVLGTPRGDPVTDSALGPATPSAAYFSRTSSLSSTPGAGRRLSVVERATARGVQSPAFRATTTPKNEPLLCAIAREQADKIRRTASGGVQTD